MPQFLSITTAGLIEPLQTELKNLNLKITESFSEGVFFNANWEECYKANLALRTSSRILKPIKDFFAYSLDELYSQIQKHDFTKYIESSQTLAVYTKITDCKLHNQQIVTLKTKDAIVDQFYKKYEKRPNIDKENPSLRIYLFGKKNLFHLSIDTSGDALFQRKYRVKSYNQTTTNQITAPLKENLAAGLIFLSNWQKDTPIIDPMCGSGTILIEAALYALNIFPGLYRKHFNFFNFKNFNKEKWEKILKETIKEEKNNLNFKFYGYDKCKKTIEIAKQNAKKAGIDEFIEFKQQHIYDLNPPCPKGMIITNPPYGKRLDNTYQLIDLYKDFSFILKNNFSGWTCWILSGNPELTKELKLKNTQKYFLYNGTIKCCFLKYEIFK